MNCPACGTALKVPASASIKFTCSSPECGQHIVVDVSEAGRFVRCPSCNKPTQVPGDPPKPFVQPVEKKALIHSEDALPKLKNRKTFSDLS
ncbi:MAG: hypothetical protein ACREGF_05205, partial [Candidatus Saccharimonadales bacterium]